MVTTSEDIRRDLNKIWENLDFKVFSDPSWDVPDMKEAKQWDRQIDKQRYIKRLFECEEIAFHFMIMQRLADAESWTGEGLQLNRPLGVAFANRIQGRSINHVVNIWVTSDAGIILMDRQTSEHWAPNTDKDNIYLVIM